MSLYGRNSDRSLFRSLNRELIKKWVDTEVDILKISVETTPTNIYGEAVEKTYYTDIRLACLIELKNRTTFDNGVGPDIEQISNFNFLRDDLIKTALVIEQGDLIDWNGELWEVDTVRDDQHFLQRNPEWNKGDTTGWNVSVICEAHRTRKSRTSLERINFGNPDE